MSTPIDLAATLDPAGGANDAVSEQATLSTDRAAVHVELSGASAGVAVHIETRLADDLGWVDLGPSATGVVADYNSVDTFDVGEFEVVRVRIVNQDVTSGSTVDVRAVLMTR
jgi:hypothetical protein